MKKAINQWSFPDTYDLRGCMEVARKAGFEGIELVLVEGSPLSGDGGASDRVDKGLGISDYQNDEFTLGTSRENIQSLKKMADEIGLKISSVASVLPFRYPLTSSDPTIREKCMSVVVTALEFASILAADTILLIPGLVTEEVSYEVAYERARSALKELARVAERVKVNIGIENVWNKFLLSPLEFRNLIDEVGSSYVGAYFDIGNVLVSGFPDQWIRILNQRIKKIHIKDFKNDIGNITGFVPLLAGDLNWPRTIDALKSVGYDDFLVAEIMPPYRYYPEQLIVETSDAMDKILGR